MGRDAPLQTLLYSGVSEKECRKTTSLLNAPPCTHAKNVPPNAQLHPDDSGTRPSVLLISSVSFPRGGAAPWRRRGDAVAALVAFPLMRSPADGRLHPVPLLIRHINAASDSLHLTGDLLVIFRYLSGGGRLFGPDRTSQESGTLLPCGVF